MPLPQTSAPPRPPAASDAAQEPEKLDRGVPPAEAERALRDLERVYRVFLAGGRDLRRLVLRELASNDSRWCLDLGAGGGHVGRDLVRDAAGAGRALKVIGVDAKLAHLLAGRRFGSPQLPLVADAEALPLRDGTVGCAFSHLFFHHFDVAQNRRVLREMCRVAKSAVVVDLRRGRLLRWLVRPGLRLLALGEVAYEDGVVSVERSYSFDDLAPVLARFPVTELRRRFPFRWALVLRGPC
jgi:ubiquinone/menaquinone biosynthesis C-methylase UbiE